MGHAKIAIANTNKTLFFGVQAVKVCQDIFSHNMYGKGEECTMKRVYGRQLNSSSTSLKLGRHLLKSIIIPVFASNTGIHSARTYLLSVLLLSIGATGAHRDAGAWQAYAATLTSSTCKFRWPTPMGVANMLYCNNIA